jgi:hypothetical protein
MSEEKFTKGEWKAFIRPIDYNPCCFSHDVLIEVDGDDIAGVYVTCDDPEWLKHREQAIHDANLMAASKDLYYALKHTTEELAFVIDRYNKKVKDPTHFIDAETCHRNQIKLAKARGEL